MAGEATNVRGPCSSCGAQLATDQRYCVECGHRVGPPLALPYALPVAASAGSAAPAAASGGLLASLPVPAQTVTTFAAIALGFGVVVGTAISPNLAGIVAAPSPTVVAQAPQPETPSAPATGGGGGGGGGGASTAVPVAATTIASASPTTSSGSGGGGGGGKKKKEKQQPTTFDGAVVRVNPVAQSYTIASNGALISIHANTLPGVGDQLNVPVRKLKNGTYAEQGSRSRSGGADSASFLGTVTYCADLEHPATACSSTPAADDHFVYGVSSVGSSVLVSSPRGSPLPAVGSQVQVGVHIGTPFTPIAPASPSDWRPYPAPCNPAGASEQNGVPAQPTDVPELTQTSLNVTGQQTSALLEAVVQETSCTDGLALSADDIREAGRDLGPLAVPSGVDQSRLSRGGAVQVDVGVTPAGGLTLKGITSDQGAGGADDVSQGQGTLVGS
jgi:hypothetical protein